MSTIADFVRGLPKAELHLHIEGTLEPEMMFDLAARNGIRLGYRSIEELRAAYQFSNLQDFLDLYYQGTDVLRTRRDFFDLAWAYLERAREQNVLHAEIFFDPQAHARRGIALADVIEGIDGACRQARQMFGMSSRLILCFLRDLDPADAMATLERALEFRDRIVAVGLDSAEIGNPPEKFEEVFARARAEGFLAVAHAGEEGPASYVAAALERLGVARIDHGNRSLDDQDLVKRLVAERIPLTICPLSNLRLNVVATLESHPLKTMMERGLLVTVNSDDPAYFGGYVNENFIAIAEALDLERDALAELARNSFTASFLGDDEKAKMLARLERYLRRW